MNWAKAIFVHLPSLARRTILSCHTIESPPMNTTARPKVFLLLTRVDSQHRVLAALACALVVFLSISKTIPAAAQATLTWSAFAAVALLLAWGVIIVGHPAEVRRTARLQDGGRTLIFTLAITASCGSLIAVWALIGLAHGQTGSVYFFYMTLAPVAVTLSWLLVHTVFTLRYAHIYYGSGEIHGTHHGGLEFPGDRLPDYLDFAYYAFVVGMTAQVSDVQVTSRRLRRLTLIHGIISFAFNTVILALTINVIATATIQ